MLCLSSRTYCERLAWHIEVTDVKHIGFRMPTEFDFVRLGGKGESIGQALEKQPWNMYNVGIVG